MKVLFYCSSIKKLNLKEYVKLHKETNGLIDKWNQKIVCECNCEKVEEVFLQGGEEDLTFGTKSLFSIEWKSCLDFEQLESYFGYNNDIWGYALHLSNVKVFDEPLSLNECENYFCEELKQAPQNMMNVKLGLDNYVLISIQPQHLAKILNGEKTIEVRKKILNSLEEVLSNER